jgi:hypothetical protein
MFSRRCAAIFAFLSFIPAAPVGAVVIDFESGFVDLQSVGAVVAGGVTTTFTCGPAGCFIVAYGAPDSIPSAFSTDDLPSVGAGNPPTGNFGLSDTATGPGPSFDYSMTFSSPVSNLSLDLIDYRDGGASSGDIATLTVFSDAGFSVPITSDMFEIPADPLPVNGNIENLAVSASGIRSARVSFTTADGGTAIDNVSFNVSEPMALALLLCALPIIGLMRLRG